MEQNIIEEKRNELNLNIRKILSIIDMIDGVKNEYEDYKTNSLNENDFLNQQLKLTEEAKNRLLNIFKN